MKFNDWKEAGNERYDHRRGWDRLDPDSMGTVTYGDATTRTFSIAPKSGQTSFKFFADGKLFEKTTTQTLACPDATGTYYWYFDTSGNLQVIKHENITHGDFVYNAISGLAYYNKEEGLFIPAKDEQHGVDGSGGMNAETHFNLHLTQGFRWHAGGEITGLADGSDVYTSVGSSVHFDEDIVISISEVTDMLFMWEETQSGVDGWKFSSAADKKIGYVNSGDTYVSYNGGTSGVDLGLIESTGATDYIIMMVLATNFIAPYDKVKVIGTQTYPSRAKARAGLNNALSAIKLRGLPSAEVEFQCAYILKKDGTLEDDGYGNAYIDLRGRKLA